MSEAPSEIRYLATHEWARLEEDGSVTVGISDHAQELLGDIVFVELPEVGKFLVGLKSRKSCRVFNNSCLLKPVEKIAFNRFFQTTCVPNSYRVHQEKMTLAGEGKS